MLLGCSPIGEYEEDRIEEVKVDVVRIPAGVEITRLFFGCDETAVELDPPASRHLEQSDGIRQPVEELAPSGIPTEALDDLFPRRDMLTFGQPAGLRIEPRQ